LNPSPLWELLRERFRVWTGNQLSVMTAAPALETVERLAAQRKMSPDNYLRHLDAAGSRHRQEIIERLVIRTTWFLREAEAIHGLVAALRRGRTANERRVKLWSVACSTGEEPYTLAIALADVGLEPTILASDISGEARNTAARAEYAAERISELPPAWRDRYFERLPFGRVRVASAIRDAVRFEDQNLAISAGPAPGWSPFDAVVCRNVLIYFDRQEAIAILRQLADACRADGYLLLSAAEHPLAWTVEALVWEKADHVPLLRRRLHRHRTITYPVLPFEAKVPLARSAPPPPPPSPPPAPTPTPAPAPAVHRAAPDDAAANALARHRAMFVAANDAARRGNAQEAQDILQRLISIDPLLAQAHLALGLLVKKAGRMAEAALALRRARFLFGDGSWLAPYSLGVCLEARCDWREALEAYRHAAAVLEWRGPSGLAINDGTEEMLASTVLESCHRRIQSLRRLPNVE
jgi:chemotaxis methyl-accepting protein methylase